MKRQTTNPKGQQSNNYEFDDLPDLPNFGDEPNHTGTTVIQLCSIYDYNIYRYLDRVREYLENHLFLLMTIPNDYFTEERTKLILGDILPDYDDIEYGVHEFDLHDFDTVGVFVNVFDTILLGTEEPKEPREPVVLRLKIAL